MAGGSNFLVRGGADFSDIEKQFQSLEKKMKGISKNLQKTGETLTKAITLPVAGAAAASFKMAADMQDAMGATDQIFGNSSAAMQKWAKNLDSYYGIASSEALEYGNMMGSMLQNIGRLTEEEAAKQSQTLIKLAGDLTAMYGGTTQDAVRALTGALKGNNTMLDNYGMAVNDAMIKTKALEMGLYDGTGQMDLQTKQAATLALIMEQTGAAQGQAAREAEGASGSMRALTTELKNLAISFGEILLPIITPIIAKINELVQKFGSLDEGQKKVIVTIALVAAAIGPLLIVMSQLITSVTIVNGAFVKLGPILFGTATKAGLLTGATTALGTAMKFLAANPIILVIAGLAALGVWIHHLWKTNEDFRNGVIEIWEHIKGQFETAKDAIINAFKVLGDGISTALGFINNIFKNAFNSIKSNIDSMILNFNLILEFIKNVFTANWKGAWENVVKLFQNIFNNIKSAAKAPLNAVIGMINKVISGLNSLSVDFPDWVPGVGGKSFGVNIPKIPKLASGAVIPPRNEFLAVLGDQTSGTNIETPERLLRQIFREEISMLGEGIVNGMAGVQKNGEPIIFQTFLNGKMIAQEILDPLKTVAKQRGVALG